MGYYSVLCLVLLVQSCSCCCVPELIE